jgi:hypothetical protein
VFCKYVGNVCSAMSRLPLNGICDEVLCGCSGGMSLTRKLGPRTQPSYYIEIIDIVE